jgi:hypothetical protein
MEKGLLEAIQLTLDSWSYIQTVDYEQLPFKCKDFHEYDHFSKNSPKSKVDQLEEKEQEQWKQEKGKKIPNKVATHQ